MTIAKYYPDPVSFPGPESPRAFVYQRASIRPKTGKHQPKQIGIARNDSKAATYFRKYVACRGVVWGASFRDNYETYLTAMKDRLAWSALCDVMTCGDVILVPDLQSIWSSYGMMRKSIDYCAEKKVELHITDIGLVFPGKMSKRLLSMMDLFVGVKKEKKRFSREFWFPENHAHLWTKVIPYGYKVSKKIMEKRKDDNDNERWMAGVLLKYDRDEIAEVMMMDRMRSQGVTLYEIADYPWTIDRAVNADSIRYFQGLHESFVAKFNFMRRYLRGADKAIPSFEALVEDMSKSPKKLGGEKRKHRVKGYLGFFQE